MKKFLLSYCTFLFPALLLAQTIADIQGTGDASPFDGQSVTTSGIVTAVGGDGYFIQDGTAIRSGIYIYDQSNAPALGDEIEISGLVVEFYNLTEIKDLTAYSVLSSGNALPDPIILTTNEINQEDYEGMLVRVEGATCTNADAGFGEFELDDGSGACRVDDLFYLFTATEGIDYIVTGPLYYSFDNYKIVPRDADDVEIDIPLYFTKAPKQTLILNSQLNVEWETNIPATSVIEYGLTPNLELGTVNGTGETTTHELSLFGLMPGTIYYVKPYSESGTDITPTSIIAMATESLSSGEMRVYFNHSVDESVASGTPAIYTNSITDTIISYIDAAQSTIDFTMYEAQSEAIVEALNNAYDRGVSIRVISDDEGDNEVLINNLNSAIPVLEGNTTGIMHNKFMITDREEADNCWVLTGSMNHTIANLGWDYNNIICIQDQSLARGYTLEFEEMWGSNGSTPNAGAARFGNQKLDNTPHCYNINGVAVESYFSPSDGTANRILQAIDAAENELAFAILVFTENSLGDAVLAAHDRGVDVKGIIDYVEFNGSEFEYLQNNGVNVLDYQNADGSQWPDGPTLHHKYAIIDYGVGSSNPLLITGSHNWTASANSVHDENTLLIYDAEMANLYQQEFWARFFGDPNSVNETYLEDKLHLFPNPATKTIEVDLPSDGSIFVFNMEGKLLLDKAGFEGIQQVDITSIPKGAYVLLFKNGEANYIQQFVKIN